MRAPLRAVEACLDFDADFPEMRCGRVDVRVATRPPTHLTHSADDHDATYVSLVR
jgi:hypothetical protein